MLDIKDVWQLMRMFFYAEQEIPAAALGKRMIFFWDSRLVPPRMARNTATFPILPMRMTSLRLLLALLFFVPSATPAQDLGLEGLLGDSAAPSQPKTVEAKLLTGQTALVPDQPLDVALKLVHPEHWHTYWLNPGIGSPTQLKWDLPEGWKTTPLVWPVPLVKTTELGNQHIYEGTTWLFTTVTPPASLKPGTDFTLKATAKWLICDEGSTCKPDDAALSLTLPAAESAEPVAAVQTELAKVKAVQPAATPAWNVKLAPAFDLNAPAPPETPEGATVAPGLDRRWTLTLAAQEGANPDPGELYFFDEKKGTATQPQTVIRQGNQFTISALHHEEAEPGTIPGGFVFASKGWLKDGSMSSLAVNAGPETTAASPAGATTAAPFTSPAGASPPKPVAARITFWGAVLSLFVAGAILNLMPCVFPVLALKVLSFARQAGKDPGETRQHSLAYTLGLLVFVWLVAGGMLVAKSAFGLEFAWGDLTRYTGPMAMVVIVLFLLGLNLAGLFEIGTSLSTVGGDLQDKKGYAGSFWSGALTMLISTPCSGPFMAVAMGYALQQPPLQQFVLFTSFGLGIAFPYVLLSSSPALLKKLPRPGAWMETFKKALAFPMFAAAIYFFNTFTAKAGEHGSSLLLWSLLFIALAAWVYGHWCVPSRPSRTRILGGLTAVLITAAGAWLAVGASGAKAENPSAPGSLYMTGALGWTKWSPATLAAERAKGRAVFVNYTTVGCITCDTNELRVFKSPGSAEVTAKFKELNVAPLRAKYYADGTPEDNAIRDSLKPWDISTFPAYIVYPANPALPPFLVSDSLLSQQQVIDALEKAVK